MANTNAPFGALPLGTMGASATYELVPMKIAYGDTTKIYTGDLVKKLSTGYIAQWTATTAVSQLAGIFMGCEYLSTAMGKVVRNNYWPGADTTADAKGFIIPLNLAAPMLLKIQTDATGVAFADIGANFDIAVGTGSTATGRSGSYLDVSTIATTATLPFRLVDLWGTGGRGNMGPGTQAGAYNWAIVAANTSGAGSTGIT